jgi:hypothetical protein
LGGIALSFVAESVVVLLEIVSVVTFLFVLYLRYGRDDQRRQSIGNRHVAPLGPRDKARIVFFIAVVVATLVSAHIAFSTTALWVGSAILTGGLLFASGVYFHGVGGLIVDRSIRYAMMMWSASCLFITALLAVLSWGAWRSEALGGSFDGELLAQFVTPLAQTAGIIIAATMVVLTNRFTADQARRSAGQVIYQKLEFASVELFRFEASHPELVKALWFEEPVKLGDNPTAEEKLAAYNLEQYVCQLLNLFEMELRFRREGIIPPDVFASWIVWMYEICCLPTFVQLWKEELEPHYITDFQILINEGIHVGQSDVPYRDSSDEPDWQKVQRFYEKVAELVSPDNPCGEVKNWLLDRKLLVAA